MVRPALYTLIPAAFLAACASPSGEFLGAERVPYAEPGFEAAVFRAGSRVQAIRTSASGSWRSQDIEAALLRAIMVTTGCADLVQVENDLNTVVTATLDCS